MATKFTYTAAEVAAITAQYTQGVALELLAEQFGKSVASIRMKLVKLGIYKKTTPSTGETERENFERYSRSLAVVGAATF